MMNNAKCLEYVERDNAVIAAASRIPYFPLVIKKAYGSTIEDMDGNQFLDLLSSASTLSVGSSNPRVIDAIAEQLGKFTMYTAAYTYNEPMIKLAEKLTSIAPGNFKKRVSFGLCGSDANDAAVKFSRAYTGRSKIISFLGGYYGSTYGSMSLSAVTTKMRRKMGPFLPEIYSFPYSYCYRCPNGKDESTCNVECMQQLECALKMNLPVEEVAAVIIEPIQGDGGLVVASQKFMGRLYDFCKDNGILFISEEVQQGLGRTGKWFCIEHFDIVPDGIVLGKSLGAGLPIGAFIAREEILNSLEAPGHVFTSSGNALCCSAANALLDILSEAGFMEEVERKGLYMKEGFRRLQEKYGIIGDIRGLGLSIGVEIVKDRTTKEKDDIGASKLSYRSYEKGLIVIYLNGNILRIQPPLTISYDEMNKALGILDNVMNEYVSGKIPDEVLKNSSGWR